MQQETNISTAILKAISKAFKNRVRLFRNQIGFAWFANGKPIRLKLGQTYRAKGGEVVLMGARPYKCGLVVGSGDHIGWEEITITQDMVGQKFARFLSIESKVPKTGRLSTDQVNWDKQVSESGGRSLVARSAEEAVDALNQMDLYKK